MGGVFATRFRGLGARHYEGPKNFPEFLQFRHYEELPKSLEYIKPGKLCQIDV
jgi:hypothetical protein